VVLDVSAFEVVLDANHEHGRELVVVADLHTAKGALDLAAAGADESAEGVLAARVIASVGGGGAALVGS
jgi:hypothetical protein